MISHHRTPALMICALLLLVSAAPCQEKLRGQLFSAADKAKAQALEKKADVYAPKSYKQAMDYYRDADDAFKKGNPIETIQTKLNAAASYFKIATDKCTLADATFGSATTARKDALTAEAPKYSPELWNAAEAKFRAAAEALEDGNLGGAREDAGEARGKYRSAELDAIKSNFLASARTLLKRAETLDVKERAPRTLEKARTLTAQTDALLQQNRYNNADARKLAQESSYEAAHAIFLSDTIAQMRMQEKSWEDVLLAAEDPLQQLAAALGVQVRFDEGYDGPVRQLVAAVKERDAKVQRAEEKTTGQAAAIDSLNRKIAAMESKLGTAHNAELEQQRKADLLRKNEENVAEVLRMFSPDEAIVQRDGNNVVIRLYGLFFTPSNTAVDPRSAALLTKVQDAIRKFPGCQVAVEGHLDAQGSVSSAQRISASRASAVSASLAANLPPTLQIVSQGYGSTRPLASNTTAEGRASNRRIDVVIVPEWAILGK